MVVKPNQPSLSATLDEWFAIPASDAEAEQTVETTGKAHGRLERRTLRGRRLTRCGQVDWLELPGTRQDLARSCWARLRSSGQERAALTYGLTSLIPEQADLAELAALWSGRWTIENRLHYVRDVTCHEDVGQAWVGQTPQALAALRNGALTLFRMAAWTNMAAAFTMSAPPSRVPLSCSPALHLSPYDLDTTWTRDAALVRPSRRVAAPMPYHRTCAAATQRLPYLARAASRGVCSLAWMTTACRR